MKLLEIIIILTTVTLLLALIITWRQIDESDKIIRKYEKKQQWYTGTPLLEGAYLIEVQEKQHGKYRDVGYLEIIDEIPVWTDARYYPIESVERKVLQWKYLD